MALKTSDATEEVLIEYEMFLQIEWRKYDNRNYNPHGNNASAAVFDAVQAGNRHLGPE